MPRIARLKNDEAVYHITSRGNNREEIFFCDDDRIRYLQTIKHYQTKFQFHVYAYCMMTNHVHLVIYSNGQDISKIMHGINLSYTQYINRKYKRCGHLFQGRFTSKIVNNDNYFITATAYTHNNPVRAQICENASEYNWSSYNAYIGEKDKYDILIIDFILNYFSKNKDKAKKLYAEFVNESKNETLQLDKQEYKNSDIKVELVKADTREVLSKVAKHFNVCVEDILQKGSKRYAKVKQITIYLISLRSKLIYKEIGKKFEITASAVAQNINKAINLKDKESADYFELAFQI